MTDRPEVLLVRWSQLSRALETAEAALSRAQQEPSADDHKALRLRVIQLQREAQRASEAIADARGPSRRETTRETASAS